jgi:hypothetical protein
MQLADDKLAPNFERNVKKLFLFLSKDYLDRKITIFSTFHSQSTTICYLPAAGAKR